MGPLVTVEWLAQNLARDDLRIADVRWYLSGKRGRDEYAAGHLPGAVFVDVDAALADPPSSARGRHPLPSAERFASAMEHAGIGDGMQVVAYDDAGGAIAARLWWLLRAAGHRPLALVLDGGIEAWRRAGRPLEHPVGSGPGPTAVPAPARVRFSGVLRPADWIADADAVDRASRDPDVLVLDARARERYLGLTEPIDARPGRVPGACSAPFAENLEQGHFRTPVDLRARYGALGAERARTVICYCGSGVTACHDILALETAGLPGALLYPGSYSQWAADAGRPVEVGEPEDL